MLSNSELYSNVNIIMYYCNLFTELMQLKQNKMQQLNIHVALELCKYSFVHGSVDWES